MTNLAPPTRSAPSQHSYAWLTYWAAADKGWGVTLRLCLILAVRWGVPVSGAVKLASIMLAHGH